MSKLTNEKKEELLTILQASEHCNPEQFTLHRAGCANSLGLTRRQLEPIYHGFKNRHVLSDRDIAAYMEYVGLAEEICNERGQA